MFPGFVAGMAHSHAEEDKFSLSEYSRLKKSVSVSSDLC